MLNELARLETKINQSPSSDSFEFRTVGKSRDIPHPFQTISSDALIATGIVHMLPEKTYGLFCKFYDRLSDYDIQFNHSTQDTGNERKDQEKLVKMLKELRKLLTVYKAEHKRKREIVFCLFRQLGFKYKIPKYKISNNVGL